MLFKLLVPAQPLRSLSSALLGSIMVSSGRSLKNHAVCDVVRQNNAVTKPGALNASMHVGQLTIRSLSCIPELREDGAKRGRHSFPSSDENLADQQGVCPREL